MFKDQIRLMAAGLTAVALLLGSAGPAQAAMMMCLYLGPSVGCNATGDPSKVVFADEGIMDFAALIPGAMGIITPIGPYVVTIAGESKPETTTNATHPFMTLGSEVFAPGGPHPDLNIELSDDGWGPTLPTLPFLSQLSSNDPQTNSVRWDAYWDPGDVLFARTSVLSSLGPINGTAGTNSADSTDFLGATGFAPFSITLVGTFSGVTSSSAFESSLSAAVPEPASVLLLGIGCLGVYGAGVRRRRQQAA